MHIFNLFFSFALCRHHFSLNLSSIYTRVQNLGCANCGQEQTQHHERVFLLHIYMATCGETFYLNVLEIEWGDLVASDGCYEDIGLTVNDLPRYYRDGQSPDGPTVLATDIGADSGNVSRGLRMVFCRSVDR